MLLSPVYFYMYNWNKSHEAISEHNKNNCKVLGITAKRKCALMCFKIDSVEKRRIFYRFFVHIFI